MVEDVCLYGAGFTDPVTIFRRVSKIENRVTLSGSGHLLRKTLSGHLLRKINAMLPGTRDFLIAPSANYLQKVITFKRFYTSLIGVLLNRASSSAIRKSRVPGICDFKLTINDSYPPIETILAGGNIQHYLSTLSFC